MLLKLVKHEHLPRGGKAIDVGADLAAGPGRRRNPTAGAGVPDADGRISLGQIRHITRLVGIIG